MRGYEISLSVGTRETGAEVSILGGHSYKGHMKARRGHVGLVVNGAYYHVPCDDADALASALLTASRCAAEAADDEESDQ